MSTDTTDDAWIIYALSDPRTRDVRYVGKATDLGRRFFQHMCKPKVRTPRSCWIQQLRGLGLAPIMSPLEIGRGEEAWAAAETKWIRAFRMRGARLTNRTDGGEAPRGLVHTPEAREKIAAAMRGRPVSAKSLAALIARNTGRIVTEETREKMRKALVGRKADPALVERRAAAIRGRKRSPEATAATRAGLMGRKHTDEARTRMREAWALRKQQGRVGDRSAVSRRAWITRRKNESARRAGTR